VQVPALGPRGEGWVAAQVVLFGGIALAGLTSLSSAAASAPALGPVGVGAILIVAGGLAALRGVLDLGANLTPFPHPRPAASLVETGSYRFVRHPVYAGIVLAGLGWSLATWSGVAVALALVLFGLFDLKARREEAWLADQVAGYAAYRERTRKFIPGLY
jgi:protein-S-isoprenylcysteine O-methyltransferase Ste14